MTKREKKVEKNIERQLIEREKNLQNTESPLKYSNNSSITVSNAENKR